MVNVNSLIAALLNANWNDVFINSLDTIDSVYDKWLNLFNSIIDVYIPILPWMNSLIRRAIRKQDRILKRFGKNKIPFYWESYRAQQNFVVKLIKKAKFDYKQKVDSLLANPVTSPKK